MKFSDMLRFSFRSVSRGKARTALSVLAVAIGVASIFLISSIGETGRSAVQTQMEKLGISGLTLYESALDSSAQPLTVSDAEYINRNVEGVLHAMPLTVQYGEYRLKNWKGNTVVWGVGDNLDSVISLSVVYGRLPNRTEIDYGAHVAVIDDALAKKIYKRDNIVGKKMSVTIGESSETFTVIGIISSQKSGINDLVGNSLPEFVYIPYTVAEEMSGSGELDQIAIQCASGADMDRVGKNIESLMNRRHRTQNGYTVENISGYRDRLDSVAGLISLFMSAVAGISLCVAGLGVMNSMLSSTSERRREIGICMAVGAQRRDVALCFLLEAFLICSAGGLAGILTGSFLSLLASRLFSMAPVFRLRHILLAELIAMVFGLTFGVIPAVRASGLNPIDALREE